MISTLGIHEVRGYARLFSSIGLKPELVEIFGTPALLRLRAARAPASPSSTPSPPLRQRILAGQEDGKPAKTFRFYPKVYKAAIAAANGTATFEEYSAKVRELEHEQPISMRHILDLKSDRRADRPSSRSTPASAATPTRS